MIDDIPEPLQVSRTTVIEGLAYAATRHNPLELRSLVDQEDILKSFNVRDTIRYTVDAVKFGDQLAFIDVAIGAKHLRGAGVQKNAA